MLNSCYFYVYVFIYYKKTFIWILLMLLRGTNLHESGFCPLSGMFKTIPKGTVFLCQTYCLKNIFNQNKQSYMLHLISFLISKTCERKKLFSLGEIWVLPHGFPSWTSGNRPPPINMIHFIKHRSSFVALVGL